MKVYINGKYYADTIIPVTAYDAYGNPQIIKPSDYHQYNFTCFQKLIVNGEEFKGNVAAESEEGMERLTERIGDSVILKDDPGYLMSDVDLQYIDRLAAYEDTGLTPEQIQAQQQEIDRLRAQNKELSRLVDADGENDYHPSDYHNPADTERIGKLEELLQASRSRLPNIGHLCYCGFCKTCDKQINYASHTYCDSCLGKAIDALLGGAEG